MAPCHRTVLSVSSRALSPHTSVTSDSCLSPQLHCERHPGGDCVARSRVPRGTPFAQCLTPQQVLIKYTNSFHMKEKSHRFCVTHENQHIYDSYSKWVWAASGGFRFSVSENLLRLLHRLDKCWPRRPLRLRISALKRPPIAIMSWNGTPWEGPCHAVHGRYYFTIFLKKILLRVYLSQTGDTCWGARSHVLPRVLLVRFSCAFVMGEDDMRWESLCSLHLQPMEHSGSTRVSSSWRCGSLDPVGLSCLSLPFWLLESMTQRMGQNLSSVLFILPNPALDLVGGTRKVTER